MKELFILGGIIGAYYLYNRAKAQSNTGNNNTGGLPAPNSGLPVFDPYGPYENISPTYGPTNTPFNAPNTSSSSTTSVAPPIYQNGDGTVTFVDPTSTQSLINGRRLSMGCLNGL